MTNFKKISFILAVLVMSIGVGYLAFAWTDAPAGTPPACPAGTPGCDRPIHVGTAAQTRAGALTINADLTANRLLDSANTAFFVDPANTGAAGLFAGNVGIGTATTPTARLEVAGGMRLNTTVARPACDATQRGTVWFVQGGTGVESRFEICTRNAAGALAWMRISLLVIPTSVTVTPNPHSQMINTTHTFSAVVHPTGTSQSVTWSLVNSVGLTGASISTAGVFSSGTTGGTVTVRATSTADPTIHGDSSVTVTVPFDFSMSVSPTSGSAVQGGSVSTTATASLTSGATQAVSFSCPVGLPSGASCSFTPTSCNPTCSSTLTISTGTGTPTGTYTITIRGTGGGLQRDTHYNLSVTQAFVIIQNNATGLTCGQVCANHGRTCASIGTDAFGQNMLVANLPLAGGVCSTTYQWWHDCLHAIANSNQGICEGRQTRWVNCRCL